MFSDTERWTKKGVFENGTDQWARFQWIVRAFWVGHTLSNHVEVRKYKAYFETSKEVTLVSIGE